LPATPRPALLGVGDGHARGRSRSPARIKVEHASGTAISPSTQDSHVAPAKRARLGDESVLDALGDWRLIDTIGFDGSEAPPDPFVGLTSWRELPEVIHAE